MDYNTYTKVFDALSHPMRIKILDVLSGKRRYVSELARMLNISRPLLCMHLNKLEDADLVEGHAEISPSGKANKFFKARNYRILVDPAFIKALSATIPLPEREET